MSDPAFLLLHLQRRARDAASVDELSFVMVNETRALLPYRQAALWRRGEGLAAVSGVAVPETNAPFTLFLERVCRAVAAAMTEAGTVDRTVLKGTDQEEWGEWLPPFALWVPLKVGPDGQPAGLLFARTEAWSDIETTMAVELAHAYGHALWALARPSAVQDLRRRLRARPRLMAGIAVAVLVVLAIPVPLTVLAPADVVAAHPAVIRAPVDGVVDSVAVHPNDRVTAGQLLFQLDDTTLKGKVEVAEKSLAIAEAEFRELSQQAVFDPSAKPKLAAAAGRRDQQTAELAYLRQLMKRIRVTAPADGTAILDDPSEWVGRPVAVGEKVLELADEHDTEIEAWLAPGDAIDLAPGAALTLFLNVAPLSPVTATVKSVAYEATARPDGTVAYRVRAVIRPGQDTPRLGLKGTARLSGPSVCLIYWLFRRPIAAARAWIGL